MKNNFTYYPKTKSVIDVIRFVYKKDDVILTIYYTSDKPILNKNLRKRVKNFVDREDEKHEALFHKSLKPFEWHVHMVIKRENLYNFLKDLFKFNKVESYHLDRLFKNYKEKKFSDGSYINQDYCLKFNPNKTFNYLIKSNLATPKEIKILFDKRGNWKSYEYGDDGICHLFNYDYQYKRERYNFIIKSLVKNVVRGEKFNIKNNKNKEDFERYFFIYTPDKSYLYNKDKKNINKKIFTYIKDKIKGSCYPENEYCYMIYQVDISDNQIINITYDVDYLNKKEIYLDILEGILYHIIDPLFQPKNKIKKYKNFITI